MKNEAATIHRRGRGRWSLACTSLLLLLCGAVFAGSPQLRSIQPTGAQRGTNLDLSLEGERLGDTLEVVLAGPGIQVLKLAAVTNKTVTAQVKIAPDCRLGEHLLRIRTASGISDWRTFFVGPFPVLPETEPNNAVTNAQVVSLNSTVSGTIPAEDQDCFAVDARKGQLLSAEVEAMRLGRAPFDPRLIVRDTNGVIVADCDDSALALQDPWVSFIAPADGRYIFTVREAAYGGGDCQYRLHIGSFPRPAAVHPMCARAGETNAFRFWSEATGEMTNLISLPASPSDRFGVFAERDGGRAPSPNWIRVVPFPCALEAPPNQDRTNATPVDLAPPLALNGVIAESGQSDWFRFKATKGQPLEVNVFARRLRSPLDSLIEITDTQGRQLAANDDTSGPDSSFKFTPPESTNYLLRITDTLGKGGHDFTYAVEITPVAPELTLKIPEVARNDTQTRQWIAVPRGNRFATLISARRANFSGDLTFSIDALPEGVTLLDNRMPANVDTIPLVFEAATNAPIAGRFITLTATATNTTPPVTGRFRHDLDLVPGPNNTFFYSTRVETLHAAVTKEAPFRIRIVEPKVPLVQAGSMRLEICAERSPGFDEPIQVQMLWNPPGVSSQSEATIPKGATNVSYQLNAAAGAEARAWKIAILAFASVDGGPVHVSSQLAPLEVATPFVTGKITPLALNPGQSSNLVCTLEQQKPFEGKATVRLIGLPERVTTAEQQITKDDKQVAFPITVATNCPTGSHKALFCTVDITRDGQPIPHTIAPGGILRVVPPKRPETNQLAAAASPKK